MSRAASNGLRVAGLFAGVGGLELGLSRAGHETALLCEVDPHASAVLRRRFRDVELASDVRKLRDLPRGVDLVAAGFPCQDFSPAGRTLGMDGVKSSLVREVFRLVAVRKPRWILLENVPFMLRLSGGRAIESVVGALEDAGYRWAYRVIDTRAFGIPQRRRRVFLLASRSGRPERVLFHGDRAAREIENAVASGFGFYWTEGNRGLGWAVDCVPTLKGGSSVGIASAPAVWIPKRGIFVPSIEDGERLQGFPARWTETDGEPVRLGRRWTMVGNAVTTHVAKWIGERLAQGDDEADEAPRAPFTRPWPAAACGDARGRHAVSIGEWPVRRPWRSIRDFLDEERLQPLSLRATEGFYGRLLRSPLKYDERFARALERHIREK